MKSLTAVSASVIIVYSIKGEVSGICIYVQLFNCLSLLLLCLQTPNHSQCCEYTHLSIAKLLTALIVMSYTLPPYMDCNVVSYVIPEIDSKHYNWTCPFEASKSQCC